MMHLMISFKNSIKQGNICRSPIAEAVFRDEVQKRGAEDKWIVDSAATSGWHTGSLPDRRARKVLQSHSLAADHKARTLQPEDFQKFDFIFGMDDANVNDIKRAAPPNSRASILMLGNYDPDDKSGIHDPYYDSGSAGFELCYERCCRAVAAFLNQHDA
jgi:low molecular weight phosphotyrosine protein phosphatase